MGHKHFIIFAILLFVLLALFGCKKAEVGVVEAPQITVSPTPKPKTAADYLLEAEEYYQAGEYVDARFACSQAVALEPDLVKAHQLLAKIHLEIGDKALSLEEYEKRFRL